MNSAAFNCKEGECRGYITDIKTMYESNSPVRNFVVKSVSFSCFGININNDKYRMS